jgi:glutathione peroxidase-family protein
MSLMFLEACKNFSNKAKKSDDDNDASKKYKNNFVLSDTIEVTLQKMLKDKKDDPEKKIPNNFEKFVVSEEFKALLEAMLDYCRELFRLENK